MSDLLFAPVSNQGIRKAAEPAAVVLALAIPCVWVAGLLEKGGPRLGMVFGGGRAIARLTAAYALLVFMNVLNYRLEFQNANPLILVRAALCVLEAAAGTLRFLLGLAGASMGSGGHLGEAPALLSLVAQALLALQLFRVPSGLFGLAKPLGWTSVGGAALILVGWACRSTPQGCAALVRKGAILASHLIFTILLFRAARGAEEPSVPA